MTRINGEALLKQLPQVRGRLEANAPLADLTWFRVGGPAEVLYAPADEADLAHFMKNTPTSVPIYPIGGTAVPDIRVARFAADNGIDGLTFLRGIPGTIGGALRMNGGAYGGETKDVLVEARAVDREGNIRVLSNADMKYTYRHSGAPDDLVFTQALLQGRPGVTADILAAMDKITEKAALADRPSRIRPTTSHGN